MKYNTKIVLAYWRECGLPEPTPEFVFAPPRKWRFDFAWLDDEYHHRTHSEGSYTRRPVAMEVEGGIWTGGRHTRGVGFARDMEKYNEAAALGWRVIRVQPQDLLLKQTVDLIKRCLKL